MGRMSEQNRLSALARFEGALSDSEILRAPAEAGPPAERVQPVRIGGSSKRTLKLFLSYSAVRHGLASAFRTELAELVALYKELNLVIESWTDIERAGETPINELIDHGRGTVDMAGPTGGSS